MVSTAVRPFCLRRWGWRTLRLGQSLAMATACLSLATQQNRELCNDEACAMTTGKSFNRADKVFADQFEPEADGNFVYRRNRSGPAIRVWPHERDQFVDDFVTARTWAGRAMSVALIVLVLAATVIFSNANSPDVDLFIGIGVVIIAVGFAGFWRWAWAAPARALAGRPQLAPQLEKSAARRENLRRMNWGQFVWSSLVLLIGEVWVATKIDLLAGWHRLILLAGVVCFALIFWRMWQKWQADRLKS